MLFIICDLVPSIFGNMLMNSDFLFDKLNLEKNSNNLKILLS